MIKRLSDVAGLIVTAFFLQLSVQAQPARDSTGQHTSASASGDSVTIHQELDFRSTPEQLYEALLDAKRFSEFSAQSGEFSAMSAKIDRAAGGAFSLFDGHIIGRNVELIPNQRIVQAWRVVDWPPGVYSIVRFEITAGKSGTHLIFDHTAFPAKLRDHLAAGWQSHYWDQLRKYLR